MIPIVGDAILFLFDANQMFAFRHLSGTLRRRQISLDSRICRVQGRTIASSTSSYNRPCIAGFGSRLSTLPVSRTFHSSAACRMFIQTEQTPNENALKFKPGQSLNLPSGTAIFEYTSYDQTVSSPLARQLFVNCKGHIDSIMFGADWITVRKKEDSNWALMKPDIFATIMDYFASDPQAPVVLAHEEMKRIEEEQKQRGQLDDGGMPEVVMMIRELLDTRIRPSVQEDGGDVEFMGFTKEGIVKLMLKGSCRGCSSSSVTLKVGIENMMKHYIPEVTSVEQVLDEAEQVSNDAFGKLEEKLQEK